MPVSPISGQTRCFNAINRANLAGTDESDEPFEARTLDASRARTPKIVVDHRHRREACGLGSGGKLVLASLTFQIAHDLRHGRLPHIDNSGAAQMVRRDLAHQRLP